jgi:hypothetical protein
VLVCVTVQRLWCIEQLSNVCTSSVARSTVASFTNNSNQLHSLDFCNKLDALKNTNYTLLLMLIYMLLLHSPNVFIDAKNTALTELLPRVWVNLGGSVGEFSLEWSRQPSNWVVQIMEVPIGSWKVTAKINHLLWPSIKIPRD